jgi:ATP synthase protein I
LSGPEPDSIASQGVRWASRVTSIGLEFALPPVFGHWLDRRWGTGALLTILGVFLGFGGGLFHLVAIAREETRRLKAEPKRNMNGSKPAADDEVTKDTGTG